MFGDWSCGKMFTIDSTTPTGTRVATVQFAVAETTDLTAVQFNLNGTILDYTAGDRDPGDPAQDENSRRRRCGAAPRGAFHSRLMVLILLGRGAPRPLSIYDVDQPRSR